MSIEPPADIGPLIVKRSRRKTICLMIRPDGSLEVRCPIRLPQSQIDAFIRQKTDWIAQKRKSRQQQVMIPMPKAADYPELNERTLALAKQTMIRFPHFRPSNVRVGRQRKRWGSCNSRGQVRLNACIALLPEPLAEYVIVHELCHLAHLNHSPHFHAVLNRLMPDAKERQRALANFRLIEADTEGNPSS